MAAIWSLHACRAQLGSIRQRTDEHQTNGERKVQSPATVAVSRQEGALPAHSTLFRCMLSKSATSIRTRHITGCHLGILRPRTEGITRCNKRTRKKNTESPLRKQACQTRRSQWLSPYNSARARYTNKNNLVCSEHRWVLAGPNGVKKDKSPTSDKSVPVLSDLATAMLRVAPPRPRTQAHTAATQLSIQKLLHLWPAAVRGGTPGHPHLHCRPCLGRRSWSPSPVVVLHAASRVLFDKVGDVTVGNITPQRIITPRGDEAAGLSGPPRVKTPKDHGVSDGRVRPHQWAPTSAAMSLRNTSLSQASVFDVPRFAPARVVNTRAHAPASAFNGSSRCVDKTTSWIFLGSTDPRTHQELKVTKPGAKKAYRAFPPPSPVNLARASMYAAMDVVFERLTQSFTFTGKGRTPHLWTNLVDHPSSYLEESEFKAFPGPTSNTTAGFFG